MSAAAWWWCSPAPHGRCQPLTLGMRDRPGHQCHAPDGERSIRPTSEGPWPGWRPIRRRPGRVQWVRASKASWVAMRRATRASIKCTRLRPLALSGRTYVARMVGWVCQVVVVERAAHSDTSRARWRPSAWRSAAFACSPRRPRRRRLSQWPLLERRWRSFEVTPP